MKTTQTLIGAGLLIALVAVAAAPTAAAEDEITECGLEYSGNDRVGCVTTCLTQPPVPFGAIACVD